MNLPVVIEYHTPVKRQPLECLCGEHGAVRPTFRIPARHICSGFKPLLYAALFAHLGGESPAIVHEQLRWTA